MDQSEIDRACDWIVGNDTGSSSKALWAVMMGRKTERASYPSDGGDLGRCLRLLEALPEWRARLPEMAAVSPYWAALVGNWPKLEALYAEGNNSKLYDFMKSILRPMEAKDPGIINLGGGASLRFSR